jgi:hypothetical protein
MIRRYALLSLTLLLAACTATLPTSHVGPDAGNVVLGIGGVSAMRVTTYSLYFRRIADRSRPSDSQPLGRFAFGPGFGQPRDYSTAMEDGVVLVHSLPAGEYEIFSFQGYVGSNLGASYFGPKEHFSIPFAVVAGQTTYLGNFQANRVDGENAFKQPVMAALYFRISDRHAAELPLARTKVAALSSEHIRNHTPRSAAGPSMLLAR